MLHLESPQHDFAQVYLMCAGRTRNELLRENLRAEAPRVFDRGADYRLRASESALHRMTIEAPLNVTSEELSDLYSRVLVSGVARAVYESIRAGSFLQRCPLCAQRDVQTLDHYLPKSEFPEFAVLPINLIPSCFECNKAKSSYVASQQPELLFHPYFDDWSGAGLLVASVVCDGEVQITYDVNRELDEAIKPRIARHFHELSLGTLYAQHAGIELIQKKASFLATFEAGGAGALREDLAFEALSRARPFPNAWQPVLYLALSSSEEFCNGGFKLIEDVSPF